MEFNEYQRAVLRTANGQVTIREQILNAALGLGEVGELQNLVKKELFHDHIVPMESIVDEMGDVLWYLTWLADLYGIDMEEVAQYNVAKLKARYPLGFSTERSINRTG